MKLSGKILSGFARSEGGNFAVVMALSAVPLLLGAGMAVDYSRATNHRATMQSSLDAATLAVLSLPKTSTQAERTSKLQTVYAASGGKGDAALVSMDINNVGAASASATATYSAPTSLMKMATIDHVTVRVKAAASKPPQLTEAKFTLDTASGYWSKAMYLYGKQYGAKDTDADEKLMQIDYTYNGKGGPKGYGTTTAYTVTKDAKGKEVKTKVQEEVCTTTNPTKFTTGYTGKIIQETSGSTKYETKCVTTFFGGATGAAIDVSKMNNLYLQMYVNDTKKTYRSDDTTTSEYLYLDGVEVKKNQKVDIFSAVPCGQVSNQAWEDGGNALPAPVNNADFYYKVTGKCDYSQKTTGIRLTQ